VAASSASKAASAGPLPRDGEVGADNTSRDVGAAGAVEERDERARERHHVDLRRQRLPLEAKLALHV
jgi:hypothetical protein